MRFGIASFGLVFMALTAISLNVNAVDLQAQSCMTEMCGEEGHGLHPFDRKKIPLDRAQIEKQLKTELATDINEWLDVILQKRIALQKVIHDASLIKNAQPASNEFNFMANVIDLLYEEAKYKAAFKYNYADIKINEAMIKGIDSKVTAEKINFFQKFFSFAVMNGSNFDKLQQVESLVVQLFPHLDEINAKKMAALQISDLYEYYRTNWPALRFAVNSPLFLQKVLSNKEINEPERVEFATTLVNSYWVNRLRLSELKKQLPDRKSDLRQIFDEKYQIYKKAQASKPIKSKKEAREIIAIMSDACIANIATKYADLPTRQDYENYKSLEDEVLEASAVILARHQFENGAENIDKLVIKTPTLQEKLIPQLKIYLKEKTTQIRNNIEELKTLNVADPQNFEAVTLLLMTEQENHYFSDAFAFCNNNRARGITDNIVLQANLVTLSPRVVTNPGIARMVLGHEIGHMVHYRYHQKLGKIEQCLTSKSKDKKSFGEDFADWFAIEVVKELKERKNVPIQNLGCGLNFKFNGRWYSESLAMPEDDDHSSHFFRALNIESQTKGLPNVCRQYIFDQNRSELEQHCSL